MNLKMPLVLGAAFASATLFGQLEIGWGESDLTPSFDRKVPLCGQYYERIATGIYSPVECVAVAIRNGEEYFLAASIDNVTLPASWAKSVREEVAKAVPGLDGRRIFINCVHTHCAPVIGDLSELVTLEEVRKRSGDAPDKWGAGDYSAFTRKRVAEALVAAWRALKPGSIARAKGVADIGHSRITMYRDGHGEMYGATHRADFCGMADSEDPNVEMLFTYDADGKWNGAIMNVCCPAQIMEATYRVSGDLAGGVRAKMRERHGSDFHVLYQVAAAGCQSPRDLVRGYGDTVDGWHEDTVELLAGRLVKCAEDAKVYPLERDAKVAFARETLSLPRRRVSPEETAEAKRELKELLSKQTGEEMFADFLANTKRNEAKGGPGPYDTKYCAFVFKDVDEAILRRAADQDEKPEVKVDVSVARVGDLAFSTAPFELYLYYGQIIKARSPFKQTCIVELCDGDFGYVPSPAVIRSRSYGSRVNNGEIGMEGGYQLCDETIRMLENLAGK